MISPSLEVTLGVCFTPGTGFLKAAAEGANLIGVPTEGVEVPLDLGTTANAVSAAKPLDDDEGGDTDIGTSPPEDRASGDASGEGPRTRDDPSTLSA